MQIIAVLMMVGILAAVFGAAAYFGVSQKPEPHKPIVFYREKYFMHKRIKRWKPLPFSRQLREKKRRIHQLRKKQF